jgi:hypothetical protein
MQSEPNPFTAMDMALFLVFALTMSLALATVG